jgi:hypothetical protein
MWRRTTTTASAWQRPRNSARPARSPYGSCRRAAGRGRSAPRQVGPARGRRAGAGRRRAWCVVWAPSWDRRYKHGRPTSGDCGSPGRSRLAALCGGRRSRGDGAEPVAAVTAAVAQAACPAEAAWCAAGRTFRPGGRRRAPCGDQCRGQRATVHGHVSLLTPSPMTHSARAWARVPKPYPLRAGSARRRTRSSSALRARACCRRRTSWRPPWTSSSPSCATCRRGASARRHEPAALRAPAPHAARLRPRPH